MWSLCFLPTILFLMYDWFYDNRRRLYLYECLLFQWDSISQLEKLSNLEEVTLCHYALDGVGNYFLEFTFGRLSSLYVSDLFKNGINFCLIHSLVVESNSCDEERKKRLQIILLKDFQRRILLEWRVIGSSKNSIDRVLYQETSYVLKNSSRYFHKLRLLSKNISHFFI